MDKKELYTSYGDFKGWGSAYTEFGNIFSTAKGTQKDQAHKIRRSQKTLEPVVLPEVKANLPKQGNYFLDFYLKLTNILNFQKIHYQNQK